MKKPMTVGLALFLATSALAANSTAKRTPASVTLATISGDLCKVVFSDPNAQNPTVEITNNYGKSQGTLSLILRTSSPTLAEYAIKDQKNSTFTLLTFNATADGQPTINGKVAEIIGGSNDGFTCVYSQ